MESHVLRRTGLVSGAVAALVFFSAWGVPGDPAYAVRTAVHAGGNGVCSKNRGSHGGGGKTCAPFKTPKQSGLEAGWTYFPDTETLVMAFKPGDDGNKTVPVIRKI